MESEQVEGRLGGVGGVRLFWWGRLPGPDPKGVLLLCHGLGEHSGRYGPVVDTVLPLGWAVYGLDHRGHGRSEGRRAHVRRYADWLTDLDAFRRFVAARHPTAPIVLLGHSMGGHLALSYALEHQDELHGLVLSAPALADRKVTAPALAAVSALARVAPTLRLIGLDESKVSKDAAVVAGYRSDPLIHHGRPTVAVMAALAQRFAELPERARDLRIPVLLQSGTADEMVDPEGTRRLEQTCGSPDLTVHWYEGLWHEIYNEPERDRPLTDLATWLAAHT